MPDFLVIGAPKAGTTALHAALARHPGLYMSAIKEPKFFLSDGPPPTKGGPGDALTYREHVWRRPDYEALFDPAPPGTLSGESTPLYLYDQAAMRRIRDTLPGAKLIVIIRDPVERAHSNWTHLWSAGLEPVGDFIRACAEEERRTAAGWAGSSQTLFLERARNGRTLLQAFVIVTQARRHRQSSLFLGPLQHHEKIAVGDRYLLSQNKFLVTEAIFQKAEPLCQRALGVGLIVGGRARQEQRLEAFMNLGRDKGGGLENARMRHPITRH